MGYRHGTQWTDEKIEKGIRGAMDHLGISRMPSRNEIKSVYGNDALTNKITRTGGFYHWADRLNIRKKECETYLGWQYEHKAMEILEDRGFQVEKMTTRHPYDLLVHGAVKVDVKVAKPYEYRQGSYFHSFNMESRYHSCDIFIMFTIDHDGEINKILVIPSNKMPIKQLSIGAKSQYDKYIDRWDYFDEYVDFVNSIS